MKTLPGASFESLGLPTETEANLDVELPGDPVDLFWAIWDEATGMMIRGLAASPCCARRILHLARAVEQWHEEGDVPGLKSLLTPDTNINCRDFSGKTPLHSLVSSQRCSLEAIGFLLHHGADVAAPDKYKRTPLHVAAANGDKEVVDLLIQHAADVAANDKYNGTPLHVAAERGHKEVVDLLIQRGADVAARDKYNRTPLHEAVREGHKEVVDLLIQRGADVAANDNDKRTPSSCGSYERPQRSG